MSDRLTRLISRHVDQQVVCDRWCSCGVQHPLGYAAHLAEVITEQYLVMPRSNELGRPRLTSRSIPEEAPPDA